MIVGRPDIPMLESDFRDQQVVPLAKTFRWKVYFTQDSRRSPEGYPDVTCCRPPRLVFLELKIGNRKCTWDQEQWLAALGAVPGVECYVIRPEDWDRLVQILR